MAIILNNMDSMTEKQERTLNFIYHYSKDHIPKEDLDRIYDYICDKSDKCHKECSVSEASELIGKYLEMAQHDSFMARVTANAMYHCNI